MSFWFIFGFISTRSYTIRLGVCRAIRSKLSASGPLIPGARYFIWSLPLLLFIWD